jgi:hypothetical protein
MKRGLVCRNRDSSFTLYGPPFRAASFHRRISVVGSHRETREVGMSRKGWLGFGSPLQRYVDKGLVPVRDSRRAQGPDRALRRNWLS